MVLGSLIKLCDIYGRYVYMRFQGEEKYKTTAGGFLSIITIITLSIAAFVSITDNPSPRTDEMNSYKQGWDTDAAGLINYS